MNNNIMSNSYQKTILLDCNRKNSLEYDASVLSDSKSIFTNRLGDGIKLNVGDQVSVQSAYVSSLGAGGEVIEFTGKKTGLQYILQETQINGSGNACNTIEGFDETFTQNVSKTFEVKDNEANMEINFYKNLNGEQYFNLPRRFDKQFPESSGGTDYSSIFTQQNTSANGATIESTLTTNQNQNANGDRYDALEILCTSDYHYNNQLLTQSRFVYKNDNSRALLFTRDGPKYYNNASATDQLSTSRVPPWAHKYIPFKKIINLKTDIGFDSPSNVASTLTQQLQKTKPAEKLTLKLKSPAALDLFNEINVINDSPISVKNESPTFQTFAAANPHFVTKKNFEFFTSSSNTSNISEESLEYFNSFQTLGILRPELFTFGRDLHGEYSASFNHTTRGAGFFELKIPISASLASTDSAITKLNTSKVGLLVTNALWENSDTNDLQGVPMLKRFKKLFEAQKLYPELFNFDNNASITSKYKVLNPSKELNASNARILHGNTALFSQPDGIFDSVPVARTPNNILGDDNMLPYYQLFGVPQPEAWDLRSAPLFLYYDESKKDVFNDDLWDWDRRDTSYDNLCFGFAKKYRHTDDKDYIALTTERLGGIPEAKNASYGFYNYNASDVNVSNVYKRMLQEGTNNASDTQRPFKFGWDFHANAYGNRFITLYTGQLKQSAFVNSSNTELKTRLILDANSTQTNWIPLTYCGAQAPLLNFDTVSTRFNLSDLYTPEYVQGQFDSGQIIGTKKNASLIPSAATPGAEVYKINKVLSKYTYCPDMLPYIEIMNINTDFNQLTIPPNTNLSMFEVFDSTCGVVISNFGLTEAQWQSSLWKILGFEYNQFNNNTDNLQKRIQTTSTPNTNLITTNAQINNAEIEEYYVNPYGSIAYKPLLPSPYYVPTSFGPDNDSLNLYPVIVVNSKSSQIKASSLPIKSSRPYYLIKSDIINDSQYIGNKNGVNLPVAAIVNKVNGYSDAFTLENSVISFTVTKPYTINTIKTVIVDPDGTAATVDESSGVIYKIVQNIQADLNVANTVFQQNQKNNRP
tara:strand:- start:491 stop:3604 length:3114 start_codon:yes stop_codon:yes gene_type:complete